MDSGGTRSASSKPIPLDVEWQRQWQRQIKGTSDEVTFPNARAYRASKSAKHSGFCLGCGLDFNYSFQGTITNVPHGLGAQIGLLGLLKTWSQVRQPLLEALTADTPCADCGGKVSFGMSGLYIVYGNSKRLAICTAIKEAEEVR